MNLLPQIRNKVHILAVLVMVVHVSVAGALHADLTASQLYFSARTMTTPQGRVVKRTIINGPPEPPPGFIRAQVSMVEPDQLAGINIIDGVPAYSWSFGCSPTSAAMIAGYYDRNGYAHMYTGPTNGGVMPLDNDAYWTTWEDSCSDDRSRCPLSATQKGLDGRSTRGHVDDYWVCYKDPGPDPYEANSWSEHDQGRCTADFMGTNKASDPMNNVDGATSFYFYNDGSKLRAQDIYNLGPTYYESSGMYGVLEFYESRGYAVVCAYNQYIHPYHENGFTYDQYKAEIDFGRPVMFHVKGHTMVGIGYDDGAQQMFIHDTWDHSVHSMAWGGKYSGMDHYAVTIVVLADNMSPDPNPDSEKKQHLPWIYPLLLEK